MADTQELIKSSVLLVHALCSIALRYRSDLREEEQLVQSHMQQLIGRLASHGMISGTPPNLYDIQALLILSVWPPLYSSEGFSRYRFTASWLLAGQCIRLAQEIEIFNPEHNVKNDVYTKECARTAIDCMVLDNSYVPFCLHRHTSLM